MIRAGRCSWLALTVLVGAGACEGGEIVVFSPAQAGSAGVTPSGGSGGLATVVAGAGGSLGGSLAAAGVGGSPTSGAGGGGGSGDKPCRSAEDCDPSLYCEKQVCSASEGVCLPAPVVDDPRQAPVCGCDDHITYWNDTLRQRSRVSASTVGPCKSGAKQCATSADCCSGSEDCALAACSIQLPNPSTCGMPGLGQCWVIPKDCDSADDKPVGLPCPPVPTPPPCLTLCQASQARRPYVRLPPTWDCP